ncbi:type VI secretion system baseplate subunit TssG [uncultured Azohydromonas sp.]|jgi:type VI secretion protein, VC_A0111 family|uniref:type VI secretion system baseplate subunit TssG n=1 Tax=uncultured Azohydromonas sp. TaxID=487342 RepID=UPI0026365E91|nr:type VI secretion system baseplate subunit TssG [uncultured Azohydromonas sp.]
MRPPSPRTGAAGPQASAIARLLQQPQHFEFHQSLRLLERWLAALPAGARPTLRFRNSLSLAFPASEIEALEVEHDAPGPAAPEAGDTGPDRSATPRRITLTPAFMGLLGAAGALPLAYTDMLTACEVQQRDGAARAFLDLFQHRAVVLFHAAWRHHRLAPRAEAEGRDAGLALALSLLGLGHASLRERLHPHEGGVGDAALAYHAGSLQRRCTSVGALQALLAHYLGVPVRIEPFTGRWCALASGGRTLLGATNATLGDSAVLGERTWQRDLRLRVCLGPLDAARHQRFLPGQSGALALRELLTLASGVSLEYEVCLRLRSDAVVRTQLNRENTGFHARLGWNTFLLSSPSPREREEAVYDLHATAT